MRQGTLDYLKGMYENKLVDDAGQPVVMDTVTRISPQQGGLLYELARRPEVLRTLEIGFAYGFSTVFLLEGLVGKEGASHCAIDPFERGMWNGIGLRAVRALGFENFRWAEDSSIHELSRLVKAGERFDLVYIDGGHRFDDILVDFYLSDQVLNVGGFLIMDDMYLASTRLVDRFIATNRAYTKVTQPVANAAVYRKAADDQRNWDHFVPF